MRERQALEKVMKYSTRSPTLTGTAGANNTPDELMFLIHPIPSDPHFGQMISKGSGRSNRRRFRCSFKLKPVSSFTGVKG